MEANMAASERERHIAHCAESRSREATHVMTEREMTERELLEAESKGRRTATDVKIAGELLKDDYWP